MKNDLLKLQLIDDAFNKVVSLKDNQEFITKNELYSILLLVLHASCNEKDIFEGINL